MKDRFRIVTAIATALVLLSSVVSQAARSHPLDEDAALGLLVRTFKQDHVYAKRISTDCITYDTEETTDGYFQFALREKHDAKCGGDLETTPVIDRYRVYRRSGKIEQWEAAETHGTPIKAHKLSSACTQVALAEASAMMSLDR